MTRFKFAASVVLVGIALFAVGFANWGSAQKRCPADREVVVFWHFWGGEDLNVVQDVVRRFNESQTKYWVREIAMPGNNLQAKLFLSISGNEPPDLVNQDDPILADWSERNLLTPFDDFCPSDELERLEPWLVPAAKGLSQYNGRFMALCNGLDVRTLFVNNTYLAKRSHSMPSNWDEFNQTIEAISPADGNRNRELYAFLPDSRRLWAWATVFGGGISVKDNAVTLATPQNVEALAWMQSFGNRYGADSLAAYRNADQSLPGKMFPLLPSTIDRDVGRYVFLMDGQWRIRDLERFNRERTDSGREPIDFRAVPLPHPNFGRENAGWINGNFFVVPRGAKNKPGAWEFMKFWIGFGHENEAAITCSQGGWIPVSQHVVEARRYQEYLHEHELMKTFVDLAASRNQFPYPVTPGADRLQRSVNQAVFEVMNHPELKAETVLEELEQRTQAQREARQ
ncbi:MAG: extracellular solute-binding protein [Pirellulaceae bacterium]